MGGGHYVYLDGTEIKGVRSLNLHMAYDEISVVALEILTAGVSAEVKEASAEYKNAE